MSPKYFSYKSFKLKGNNILAESNSKEQHGGGSPDGEGEVAPNDSEPSAAINALVCGYAREDREAKILMMLEPVEPYRAYIDDSSSAEDDRILLLAGYAQRAPVWAAFSDEWKIELAKPPAIEYCHMSEAESLKDQFRGWSATKRDRKIASLANVIVKYEPWSIECYVRKSQYDQILDPVIAYDLRGPYFPCFYGVIVSLARYHAQTGVKLPTDFIFDEQGKIGVEAVSWYEAIKRTQKPEIQALMGSTPQFLDDKKILPLQAADYDRMASPPTKRETQCS